MLSVAAQPAGGLRCCSVLSGDSTLQITASVIAKRARFAARLVPSPCRHPVRKWKLPRLFWWLGAAPQVGSTCCMHPQQASSCTLPVCCDAQVLFLASATSTCRFGPQPAAALAQQALSSFGCSLTLCAVCGQALQQANASSARFRLPLYCTCSVAQQDLAVSSSCSLTLPCKVWRLQQRSSQLTQTRRSLWCILVPTCWPRKEQPMGRKPSTSSPARASRCAGSRTSCTRLVLPNH